MDAPGLHFFDPPKSNATPTLQKRPILLPPAHTHPARALFETERRMCQVRHYFETVWYGHKKPSYDAAEMRQ